MLLLLIYPQINIDLPLNKNVTIKDHIKDNIKDKINPITPGVSDQRLLPGGVFRTRSYFQLIWTPFWTRGTIFEQLIVKGVHQ